MTKGALLWGPAQGGSAIASFAGQPVELRTLEFPAAATGKTKVRTGGGLRMEGWIEPSQLPLVADHDLDVVPGHVAIASGVRLAFASAAGGQLTTAANLTGPTNQSVPVTAPCSAYTLNRRTRTTREVPGNARGYLPKNNELSLFDDANTQVIFTVRVSEPGGMLLWSTESRGAFVHIVYHEDLVIDAWARASDLVALKQGETMDQPAPATSVTGSARLAVGGQPIIVRATKDVPLRLSVKDGTNAPPIGYIEAGAEMYVMETVVGWSSVLPRALNLLPPGDHSFWVPAYEVGMGTAPGAKP